MATTLAASKERLILSPPGLTATVWKHFGFYERGNRTTDKTYAICKICKAKIKYLSNTTNMRQHLVRFHPEMEKAPPVMPATQRTILETVSKLPKNLEKARSTTKAIATFITMDLHPYSVVKNRGFRLVVHTMEPRYKLPHRKYFAEKEIPHLYNETKANVLESMKKASRVALTCDAWILVATKSFITITAHFVLE